MKRNRKTSKKQFLTSILIASILILIGIFSITAQKASNSPTDQDQFLTYSKPRWAMRYIFGDEDKSMFPVVTDPHYVSGSTASEFLNDEDIVYTVQGKDHLYTYPAAILSFHHIVNDVIDEQPVAVTLCLLTSSAAVYERKIGDDLFTFGVLGNLYNGNLIMFDNETNSYWLQITGESIEGYMTNTRLSNAAHMHATKWKDIKDHVNITVLAPIRDMEFYREFYGSFLKSPYGLESLGKRSPDSRFDPFTIGLGIEVKDEQAFYKLDSLKESKVHNDELGGWPIVVTHDRALDNFRIFKREVDNRTLTFTHTKNGMMDDETGSVWDPNGTAIKGPLRGEKLVEPIYTTVYWFSWSTFFPETTVY